MTFYYAYTKFAFYNSNIIQQLYPGYNQNIIDKLTGLIGLVAFDLAHDIFVGVSAIIGGLDCARPFHLLNKLDNVNNLSKPNE